MFSRIFNILNNRGFFRFVNDKHFLKIIYYDRFRKKLNLKNPSLFTEKLQWLKLYDRNPLYTKLVDKYAVREYIKEKLGEEYLIPLIAVYDKVDEIEWDKLPNQFVIKCTHGSGSNIICKDKNKLSIRESKKKLKKWMRKNWYWFGREWPYKNVKPRIIIEKFMVDANSKQLKDYKLMCFNGSPKIIQVMSNRINGKYNLNHFSITWENLNFEQIGLVPSNEKIDKPKNLDRMVDFARELSKNIPFVRLDFYEINGELFFGEFTLYPVSGFHQFEDISSDVQLGNMLSIDFMERKI